jgi:hypothetical protein
LYFGRHGGGNGSVILAFLEGRKPPEAASTKIAGQSRAENKVLGEYDLLWVRRSPAL